MSSKGKAEADEVLAVQGRSASTEEQAHAAATGFDGALLLSMYRLMRRIRLFEERAAKEFAEGAISGALHLSIGQEAIAVGLCTQLREDDVVTTSHRGHSHCLAKGVSPEKMVAELLGRTSGVCRGKGGSMHMADVSVGVLGANGIVAGGLPLACGAGLVAKTVERESVAMAFFGDGGANIGAFGESLNLAAVLRLPVVFVAENNGYAEATPFEYHFAGESIAARASGYGLPSVAVDGTDLRAVYSAGSAAIARARAGEGPSFIEARAIRFAGHHEGDMQTYRMPGEHSELIARDPIKRTRKLVDASDTVLKQIEGEETSRLDAAWAAAKGAPFPDRAELITDVYVNYRDGIS